MPLSRIARVSGIIVFLAIIFMAAVPKEVWAGISCDGSCDSVVVIDSTTDRGCIKLRVVNRGLDGGGIFAYRIITSVHSPDFICGISSGSLNPSDPSRIWNRNTHAYITENPDSETSSSRYFWDASFLPGHLDTAALPPCDSGWIELCLCCGLASFDMPIQIVTYHWNPGTMAIDSCVSKVMYPNWYSGPCGGGGGTGGFNCTDTCDELTADTETVAGELHICVTVTRKRVGALTNFKLDWIWPAGCPQDDSLRLISAPPGWNLSNGHSAFDSLWTDSVDDIIPNCGSATFCFALGGCGPHLCNSLQIKLESIDNYSYACMDTVTVFGMPNPDLECCDTAHQTRIWPVPEDHMGNPKPTQDSAGVWTQCFVIHRSDADPLTKVIIDHCHMPGSVNPRCWQVSNVPLGWKLSGSSGCVDTFKIDGAANTGCRTFEWCYSTCDCKEDGAFINDFNFSDPTAGEHFTTTDFLVNTTEENAVCCTDGWHKHDYVTVTGTSPTCIALVYHNTHHVNSHCCKDDQFSFTLPAGCHIISVGLPAGWCWDTVGSVVGIFPCADEATRLDCCASLTVDICTDCLIGFSNWTTNWSSSDTCGDTFDDTISYCGGCHGGMKTSTSQSTPQLNEIGQQNFPNPFGPETGFQTTIPFQTNATGMAYIRVMDQTGRVILKDNESVTYAGTHFFYFTGKELPAGQYYYQIEFPSGVVIVNRTMILVK